MSNLQSSEVSVICTVCRFLFLWAHSAALPLLRWQHQWRLLRHRPCAGFCVFVYGTARETRRLFQNLANGLTYPLVALL
jgi:hypothetical protein